jgi:hypothetical protein
VDQETGEYGERRLGHREEAVGFYSSLAGRKVVVGLEATGNDRWFRKLVMEARQELLVGDANAIHVLNRASSGPTSGMRDTFCVCWWRSVFPPSGSHLPATRRKDSC